MSRKHPKRRAGIMAFAAIAGIFIVTVVGGLGLGVAAADSSDEVALAGAFGFSNTTQRATSEATVSDIGLSAASQDPAEESYREQSALASASPRNVSAGMKMIDDMERAEQERIAADNIAVFDRVAVKKAMQGVASSSNLPAYEYDLPAVDWSVGYEAFIAEWTSRIDAYLDGSPLAGYGAVFAQAAWENGVDPRWSPAISNTESGKGLVCFLPCNAWGWGDTGWDSWESAIRAHVAGLGSGYGYCITLSAAQAYCPPNWYSWYYDTLGQMSLI